MSSVKWVARIPRNLLTRGLTIFSGPLEFGSSLPMALHLFVGVWRLNWSQCWPAYWRPIRRSVGALSSSLLLPLISWTASLSTSSLSSRPQHTASTSTFTTRMCALRDEIPYLFTATKLLWLYNVDYFFFFLSYCIWKFSFSIYCKYRCHLVVGWKSI